MSFPQSASIRVIRGDSAPSHAASRTPRAAFTLIELLLAALLAAGIAGAIAVSLSQALRARAASESRGDAFSRASAAVDRIALDIQNLVRTGDLFDARVLLVEGGVGQSSDPRSTQRDELLLFSFSPRPARPLSDQNEGAVYEVQYRLQTPPDPAAAAYVLWRRADPVPDDTPDGGGVASPIVRGIASLSIEAFDGSGWHDDWDSDRDGYPHALRITVLARSDDRIRPVEAFARRTIAIDRTPTPYATVSAQAEGTSR